MIKNFILCCLLVTALPFMAAAQVNQLNQNNSTKASQVTDDWQKAAEAYIAADEYHFKQAAGNYYAANKKQRIGTVISPSGFILSPLRITDKPDKKNDWSVNMQLSYIGKGMFNVHNQSNDQAFSSTGKSDLTVRHSGFDIQYINTEEGLRQNFVINNKPAGDKLLSIDIQVSGNLTPVVNNNELQLKDAGGSTRLFYRDLKVWDASHTALAAGMKMNKHGKLEIIVDDSKAVYPITVDPINQTPDWTTSADGILPTLIGQLAVNAAYGFSIAGLGDVNNDGYDDVAVGAPAMVDLISGTGTLASVGAVFVYFGSANGLPVVPSAKLQPTTAVAGALFGFSIAGGDINNDGKADIIVGAPMDNVSLAIGGGATATGKVGKAYVFSGATLQTNTTPFLILQLSGTGILENGVNLSVKALFGFSVAVTEDLNNDGKKDMIVGAPAYAGIKAGLLGSKLVDVQSGGAFVFLSNAANNNLTITKLEPIKTSLLGLGLLESNISGLLFGYSVDGLGDYNGDGKPDVVASAPAGVNASSINALLNGKLLQGSANVYYGTGTSVNVNPGATLTATSGGLLSNLVGSVANVANLFGTSVKGVRQANGTRNGNVLVGAPLGNAVINVLNLQLKTGTVSVFKKKTTSPGGYVVPDQVLTSPRNSNNILQVIQSNLLFGYALDNVLDINCDGYGDIIVGEPASSGVQLINANVAGGAAYVYLGKADGTYQAAPVWTLTATADAFLGVNATSLIGYSVAGAGKVKGSAGNNRILVGSPSRTLDFGTGLLNLGNTFGTLFSLVAGNNGVGKAFEFDTKQCFTLSVTKTDALCNGDNSGSVTAIFSDGTGPYMIKIDNGNYAAGTSPATFTGLASGSHTITVKDANGTEKSISVIINTPAAITATTSKVNPACPGASNGSFNITASGGTGTLTYSKDAGATYQSSGSFTGLQAGNYNWKVKDANGCTASGQVTLVDPITITATTSVIHPSYFGATDGSFTLNASGGTGVLSYSKDGGTTYQSSNIFNGLSCGSYNWTVKDANGCIKNGQVTLNCAPDLTFTVTSNNPSCNGSATGSFTLIASGGTGILSYSKDGGTTFQSSGTFTALTAGVYNWVIKDANGYTKNGQVTLTDPATINATTSQVNPACPGASNGSFNISAGGGTGTLTYSKDAGATYQSSNIFTGLAAGIYNWKVKDANGCTKSGQVILTDPPAIISTATKTNPTYYNASDGSFTINATGGTGVLTYSKNGGTSYQSSNTFTGLPAGTYNWVVKDANGCTKSGQVVLACPIDISVTVTKNNPLCCSDPSGSFTLTASGGTGTLSYSKDGGTTYQSSNTFTGLSAGTYNWVVKDATGYTKSGQVNLVNPPAINASTTQINPTTMSSTNGSFKIIASGGTGTLTYSKNGGSSFQSGNSFTNLDAATYNWVVMDVRGCRKTGQVTLACPNKFANAMPEAVKPVIQVVTGLTIYPNPATDFVTISFVPAKTGKTSIALYAVSGKYISTIYIGTTESGKLYQEKINLGKLAPGVYIIRLANGNMITNEKLFILD
ncbi:MAG: T9SS type A sorting domain-containing protein [Ferruginibacter sp.]